MTDVIEPTTVTPPGQQPGDELATTEEAAALAIASETTLEQDEEVIRRELGAFMRVGTALNNIRIAQKYREGYATFKEYLRLRWDISDEYAYQTMDGAKDVKALPSGTPQPINLAQARALHKVPVAWRSLVMVEAASADHLTARVIDIAFDTIAIRAAGDIPWEPVVQFLFDDLYVNFPGDRQIKALAKRYTHAQADERDRIRQSEEIRTAAPHRLTPEEWLMRQAVIELEGQTTGGSGPHKNSYQLTSNLGNDWYLGVAMVGLPNWATYNTPGKPATSLKWRGKTIKPSKAAKDKRQKAEDAAARAVARNAPPDDPAAVCAKLPVGQQEMLSVLMYWRDHGSDSVSIFDRTLRRALITAHLVTEDGETSVRLTPAGVAVAAQVPADVYARATEDLEEEDAEDADQQQQNTAPPPDTKETPQDSTEEDTTADEADTDEDDDDEDYGDPYADESGAWISASVLRYLISATDCLESIAIDEDGISFVDAKPDEVKTGAAGLQAACDKLIDAVSRAEEQAAAELIQGRNERPHVEATAAAPCFPGKSQRHAGLTTPESRPVPISSGAGRVTLRHGSDDPCARRIVRRLGETRRTGEKEPPCRNRPVLRAGIVYSRPWPWLPSSPTRRSR